MTKARIQLDVNDLNNVKMNELRSTAKILKDLTGNTKVKLPTTKSDMVNLVIELYEQYEEDLLLEDQEDFIAPVKKSKSKFKPNSVVKLAKPVAPRQGTIEHTLVEAITSGNVTIDEITQYVVKNHERPRSLEGVDENYAVHNIKWFVKKGHLKLAKA